MRSSRRRAFALAGLSLLLGGLAASDVAGREAAIDARIGDPVSVVVARAPIDAGSVIRRGDLTTRAVPERFAPHGAFADPRQVAGQRSAASIAAGADVTAAALEDPAAEPVGAPVERGERIAEVLATGAPELVVAGARVDVLVSRDDRPGVPAGTRLALEDVEVLQARAAPPTDAGSQRVRASLRVTLRQAVYLAAAQGFASEIRLLVRPAGEVGRSSTTR